MASPSDEPGVHPLRRVVGTPDPGLGYVEAASTRLTREVRWVLAALAALYFLFGR